MIKTAVSIIAVGVIITLWWLTTIRNDLVKKKSVVTAPRGAHTIIDVLLKMANKYPDHPAMMTRRDGIWRPITYKNYLKSCNTFARGLRMMGVKSGDRVGIIGFNAPGWIIAHLGCFMIGAVSVGIYPTNKKESCDYIMEHSEIKALVVENKEQFNKFTPTEHLLGVISYSQSLDETEYPVKVYNWNEFMVLAHTSVEMGWQHNIKPSDNATFIYTSGTTGKPKAAMITHGNIVSSTIGISDVFNEMESLAHIVEGHERFVSYLPLNHIAAQMFDIYVAITCAATVYFADPNAMKGSLLTTLLDVRPTVFIGVPRVWEKIAEKVQQKTSTMSGMKQSLLSFGKWWCPDLINKKTMENIGLDKCKYRITAAAPISQSARNFFTNIGYPLCDLYGMSETTGLMTISLPETQMNGSVGKVLPGLELMIENNEKEGEILVKGGPVFNGYFKQDDKTDEIMTNDGWMKTGDIGKLIDNYLYLTGRSKDIIITQGGENITPTLIEDTIKEQLPIIDQVVVIGDQKKFLSALITLSTKLDDNKIPTTLVTDEINKISEKSELVDMVDNDKLRIHIQKGIDNANKKATSSAQTIKKWIIIPEVFSVDSGHLTPTMKLKRQWVVKKYSNVVDELYK